MKPKVAHIIVTDTCTHNCPKCCNKNYDIGAIPLITKEELESVDTICLTGGEPFLSPRINEFVERLRPYCKNLYVYASGRELYHYFEEHGTLPNIDGLSLSPKTYGDWECVWRLMCSPKFRSWILLREDRSSNRLYTFIKKMDSTNAILDIGSNTMTACSVGEQKVFEVLEEAFSLRFKVIFREWQDEIVSPEGEIFRNINFNKLGI